MSKQRHNFTNEALFSHYFLTHGDIYCVVCGIEFHNIQTLNKHIERERHYGCEECFVLFESKKKLNEHKKGHIGEDEVMEMIAAGSALLMDQVDKTLMKQGTRHKCAIDAALSNAMIYMVYHLYGLDTLQTPAVQDAIFNLVWIDAVLLGDRSSPSALGRYENVHFKVLCPVTPVSETYFKLHETCQAVTSRDFQFQLIAAYEMEENSDTENIPFDFMKLFTTGKL